MAAYLTIPKSQQLRFVNRTQETNTVASFDTRLYNHYKPSGIVHKAYQQLIEQTDSLVVQFRTSYTSFTLTLVKELGYVTTSYNGDETLLYSYTAPDGTAMSVYSVTIDVSALTGVYFFIIEANTVDMPYNSFWSEPFNVQAEHEGTQLLKYGGNSGITDQMQWGTVSYVIDTYQYNRISSRILEPNYTNTKSTYTDSSNELTNLNAHASAVHVLELEELPFYIIEKINLALAHDEFYVDDIMYNTKDEIDLTMWPKKQMGTGKINLTKVEYENGLDEVLTGDNPVIDNYAIYAGAGVAIYGGAGVAIGFYN